MGKQATDRFLIVKNMDSAGGKSYACFGDRVMDTGYTAWSKDHTWKEVTYFERVDIPSATAMMSLDPVEFAGCVIATVDEIDEITRKTRLKLPEKTASPDEELYLVAQTSPNVSGYFNFAELNGGIDGLLPQDVTWSSCHTSPHVTYFKANERRKVLGLFAKYPKVFYRCEIAPVSRLDALTHSTRPQVEDKRLPDSEWCPERKATIRLVSCKVGRQFGWKLCEFNSYLEKLARFCSDSLGYEFPMVSNVDVAEFVRAMTNRGYRVIFFGDET